jgi:RNA polymerase sigma-70 factor (ECF subfamily)
MASARNLSTDSELLEQFLQGPPLSDQAFNSIVLKYQERIYYLARRFVETHDEADDIVQETFVKAYSALRKFRGDSSLYTWLYRIATNIALNYLRGKSAAGRYASGGVVRLDGLISSGREELHLAGSDDASTQSETNETEALIQRAIEKLPPKQRLVFTLRYFEEMPYDEMSKVLKTSTGSLKASYFHAVKKIGKELKKVMGEK